MKKSESFDKADEPITSWGNNFVGQETLKRSIGLFINTRDLIATEIEKNSLISSGASTMWMREGGGL
jgi:hypothetical protein